MFQINLDEVCDIFRPKTEPHADEARQRQTDATSWGRDWDAFHHLLAGSPQIQSKVNKSNTRFAHGI